MREKSIPAIALLLCFMIFNFLFTGCGSSSSLVIDNSQENNAILSQESLEMADLSSKVPELSIVETDIKALVEEETGTLNYPENSPSKASAETFVFFAVNSEAEIEYSSDTAEVKYQYIFQILNGTSIYDEDTKIKKEYSGYITYKYQKDTGEWNLRPNTKNDRNPVKTVIKNNRTIVFSVKDFVTGKAIEGANVMAALEGSQAGNAVTNTKGSAVIKAFYTPKTEVDYTFSIQKEGYNRVSGTVQDNAGAKIVVKADLEPISSVNLATVKGFIRNSNSNPIEGAIVSLKSDSSNITVFGQDYAVTKNDGSYKFEMVPAGRYYLEVIVNGNIVYNGFQYMGEIDVYTSDAGGTVSVGMLTVNETKVRFHEFAMEETDTNEITVYALYNVLPEYSGLTISNATWEGYDGNSSNSVTLKSSDAFKGVFNTTGISILSVRCVVRLSDGSESYKIGQFILNK